MFDPVVGDGVVASTKEIERIAIVLVVLMGVSGWFIFEKAGKPGWAVIVPFYNFVVLLDVVGRPIWWFVLFYIPFVNLAVLLVVCRDLARSFGQGTAFGVCLALLFPVFLPVLAFGGFKYVGPAAAQG